MPILRRLAWLKPSLQGLAFRCARTSVLWSADSFPDIMTRTMLVSGSYQEDVIGALSGLLKSGDVVFDVGAHHGLMSIIAGRLVGETGHVFAFEPNPLSQPILAHQLELNGVRNVSMEPLGLMDQESVARFYPDRGTCSWNSTFIRDFATVASRDHPVEIRTTTIDQFVAERGCRPNLMKIDTEGSELFVLKGSRATLEEARPALILEFNPIAERCAGVTCEEIAEFLRALEYEFYVMPRDRLGHYSFARRRRVSDGELVNGSALRNVICISRKNVAAS